MSEQAEPVPSKNVTEQLLYDLANMTKLRQEMAELSMKMFSARQRINNVSELLVASAEHRLPHGYRLYAYLGGVSEIWRKDESGEYIPYGFVDTKGENYPFIATGVQMKQIGKEEAVLLTNQHFNIAVTAFEIAGVLQIDDPRSQGLVFDFDDFVELFHIQNGKDEIVSNGIFGPTETPQV